MALRRLALAWPMLATAVGESGGSRSVLGFMGEEARQWRRTLSTTSAALARIRRVRTDLAPHQTEIVNVDEVREVEPQTQASLNLPAVAGVVQHPSLIVTRPIEWGTVLLGFEQANRYSVYDEHGVLVAHLLEEEGGFGRAIGRQLLKTRRPFSATVLSADGSEVLFRVRRPMYLINSSMYIEDGAGDVVGEVQQRWHLWRRNYDLYIERRQFAAIEGGFLAWDFELKDEQGGTLALIDRNFQGFGKELFTDAGRYAVHFGDTPLAAAQHLATAIRAQHPDQPPPSATALAQHGTGTDVIPTATGNQLVVRRPLHLTERMVALAAAISIDYDFFSRHSTHGGGLLSPFLMPPIIPYPVPLEGAGPSAEAADGSLAGEQATGQENDASPGATSGPQASFPSERPGPEDEQPLERNLGDDSFWGKQDDQQDDFNNDDDGGSGGLFSTLSDLFSNDDDDGW